MARAARRTLMKMQLSLLDPHRVADVHRTQFEHRAMSESQTAQREDPINLASVITRLSLLDRFLTIVGWVLP